MTPELTVPLNVWLESPFGTLHKVGSVDLPVTDSEDGAEPDIDRLAAELKEVLKDAG